MKAKIVGLHPEDEYFMDKQKHMNRIVSFDTGAFKSAPRYPGYLRGYCVSLDGEGLYFKAVKLDPSPVSDGGGEGK